MLKKALQTQQSHATTREEELKEQLSGLWQRADKERKMLMSQVSQLKDELKTSSPQKLVSDLTSRFSDLKTTVSNIKDGAPISDKGLWQFDSEGEPIPGDAGVHACMRVCAHALTLSCMRYSPRVAVGRNGESHELTARVVLAARAGAASVKRDSSTGASMSEREGAYRNSTGADGGSAKWRIKALEARVAAQQDEIRELKAQLAEREQALTRLQQRNGVLGARLEDKEHDIATLEGRLAKLKRRLKESDSFAPRAWAVKEAVQGGYALEAAGLVPSTAAADSSRPNGGATNWLHGDDCDAAMVPGICVCMCICVYVYMYTYTYIHACMYTSTKLLHTHTHTHTHTHSRTHTHALTHTQAIKTLSACSSSLLLPLYWAWWSPFCRRFSTRIQRCRTMRWCTISSVPWRTPSARTSCGASPTSRSA